MRMMSHAFCTRCVSLSSKVLGLVLLLGWLWQSASMVALRSRASFMMMRMSTAVSVIPPCDMRLASMSL